MLNLPILRSLAYAFALIVITPSFTSAAIINGDFSTGDFSGWTIFSDPNGTANGDPNSNGLPDVVSFDVSGGGPSAAAQFRVGRTGGASANQGGGIFQTIQTAAGDLILSVDFALESTGNNAQGGLFELTLNGVVVDFTDVGAVTVGEVIRGNLNANVTVDAGDQDVRLSVRRQFFAGSASTPSQYFDNVSASGSAVAIPEPATTVLLSIVGLAFAVCRHRSTRSACAHNGG